MSFFFTNASTNAFGAHVYFTSGITLMISTQSKSNTEFSNGSISVELCVNYLEGKGDVHPPLISIPLLSLY